MKGNSELESKKETQLNDEILKRLEKIYYRAKPGLDYNSAFELLVATILSAQCTDVQVNKVTKELYKTYNTPEAFAALTSEDLEPLIRSCGYYKAKASNIINASRKIVQEFGSSVPDTMEELISLPGVGRKTANVVLSNAFGKDAIAVDTHVFRVANRLGLASASDVLKTEMQLMKVIPKEKWSDAHHWLIWHGRRICSARNPKCTACPLNDVCRYFALS